MPFFVFNSLIKKQKKETYNNSTVKTTWYIAGHIYERVGPNGELLHTEITISGGGRLGVAYTNTANNSLDYNYELSDHLGNVRAVIRKAAPGSTNPIDILSYADYFPFGWQMPGRNQQGDYRYAYQGQEKDPETGWEAFELRMYDGRVGRWMTTDPYSQYHSPYLAMGNRPISGIDPDGGKFFDWVEVGGEMFYDSKIRSQEQATAKYGKDAIHHEVGTTYMSDEGNVMLGALGTFTLNGALYESVDHAGLSINRHPSVAYAGMPANTFEGAQIIASGIGVGISYVFRSANQYGMYVQTNGITVSYIPKLLSDSDNSWAIGKGIITGRQYVRFYSASVNTKMLSRTALEAFESTGGKIFAGRAFGVAGLGLSGLNLLAKGQDATSTDYALFGMDTIMTGVMLFGGPIGATVSGVYFAGRFVYDVYTVFGD